MAEKGLPSFDLVLATVGRARELRDLLDSLERQSHRSFRLLIADQNADRRLEPLLGEHPGLEILRLEAPLGLSRARNALLDRLRNDVVAFPDDDCAYPSDLLERVARRLEERSELDGVSGRVVDSEGRSSERWPTVAGPIERERVWHGGSSATVFLRRSLVERVGPFDEQLGLGSGTTWCSGEEIDYLLRALDAGARLEYDPELVVLHRMRPPDAASQRALGLRDGASVGFILRKHRFPARVLARMLVRPLGGAVLALARGDLGRARFYTATLRGRIAGYAAGGSRR
ncbi:MAG: glycosyltransferase family 2 protein [Gaiellaceae bacterium]